MSSVMHVLVGQMLGRTSLSWNRVNTWWWGLLAESLTWLTGEHSVSGCGVYVVKGFLGPFFVLTFATNNLW